MTTVPEPSDATRFATRPKQRKAELVNATDNEMGKLRKETIKAAMTALASVGPTATAKRREAHRMLEEGMWRQWVADDRTLDPETVAEAFTAATERHETDIRRRAVLAQHGIRPT